jgi:DNA replication protein DnaD
LDDIAANPDLINQALDIAFEQGRIVLRRYSLP